MADEVVVHPEEVRVFISRIAGICKILDAVPDFLNGENGEGQAMRLSEAELGGHPPFHKAWKEICDNREDEAKQIASRLRGTRNKLIRALEKYTKKDEEIAATFPTGLLDASRGHGLDSRTPEDRAVIDRLGRNIPE